MILLAITDWIQNFFWDSIYRFFIYVIDNVVYSLIGFAYKVFLILGTLDLFGGYTSGTEGAMEVYQAFSKRIYSVIGIVIMFILAYQIILFVIDPDKGIKESRKLVTNVVKGIILTIIAPLVFHYLSIIQYHVLVSDNLIWNIVLGEHASQSNSVVEGGNTMASMLYISVFHPIGTEFSDFYDTDGSLKPSSDACANYIGGNISQDTVARTLTGAGVGFVIGSALGNPGLGAVLGGIIQWMRDASNSVTTCEYYYWYLYQGGLPQDKVQDVKPNEVSSITNYSESKVGYRNKAHQLASHLTLIDEIYQENNMEYYFFAPLGGIVILVFIVSYTLDVAVRAFKLAFLQMIAPVPILLGTIPKNEKLYTSWREKYIKTYIDIFVRVFVIAFIALMIKLLPSIFDTLFGIFKNVSAEDESKNFMLKAVTYFALVIGLLRAGKEIPDMIKDLAKNASGLLSGIDLSPKKSFTKVKEAVDAEKKAIGTVTKPIGAVAGGFLGAKSAMNAVKNKGGGRLDSFLAGARGLQIGTKTGFEKGLGKGSLTQAMRKSNERAIDDKMVRDTRAKEWKEDKRAFFNNLTEGRLGEFTSAMQGSLVGVEDSVLYAAGTSYQTTSNGILQRSDSASKAAKADVAVWDRNAAASLKEQYDDNGNLIGYTASWKGKDIAKDIGIDNNPISREEAERRLEEHVKKLSKDYVNKAEINAIAKSFETTGVEDIMNIANSNRNLNAQYADTIRSYPQLEETIKSASKSAFESKEFSEVRDLLKDLNNGIDPASDDYNKILELMGDRKFANAYNEKLASLNEEDQKKLRTGVAKYVHSLSKAEKTVGESISNIKGGLEGTKVSYFANRSVNNLGSGPKDK